MKRIKVLVFSMLAAMMLASCGTTQKVPLTGRTHRISVSDAQVLSLSNQEYTKYMASAKKSTNAAKTAQVVRVGKRLAAAVETYLKENGYANDLQNYSWEFNLVQDNSVNAFCMPGGKIVVYEGLLRWLPAIIRSPSYWDMRSHTPWLSIVPSSFPRLRTSR